jgi:heat-inducible transcriptional repressor
MERASHLLSQASQHVGLVVPPAPGQEALQQIEFVRLSDGRILVITASQTGMVQHRVIRIDTPISQDELDRTARYLSDAYRGYTLTAIRAALLAQMSEEKALYDTLLRTAILVCESGLADTADAGVYVDGTVTIIDKPDFADTERLRGLFRMFEEKSRLVKILNECLSTQAGSGVRIQIGAENRTPDLQGCSIVASPFQVGEWAFGGIGVVGPTRMEYARVIGIVDYVARLVERVLLDSRDAVAR